MTDLLTEKGRFEARNFPSLDLAQAFVWRCGVRSATMFRQHPYVFSTALLVTTMFRLCNPFSAVLVDGVCLGFFGRFRLSREEIHGDSLFVFGDLLLC